MKLNNFLARQLTSLFMLAGVYLLLIDIQSEYDKTEITTVEVMLLYLADIMVAWVFVNLLHYLFRLVFNQHGYYSYLFITVTSCFYVFFDRVAMTTFDQHISMSLWEAAFFAIKFNELHLSYKTFVMIIGVFLFAYLLAFILYRLVYRLVKSDKNIPIRFSIFVFIQLNVAFWLVNIAVYKVGDPERVRYLLPFSDFFNVATWLDDEVLRYPELRTDRELRTRQMSCVKKQVEKFSDLAFAEPKNILMVVAESLRSDMLDPQRMPKMSSVKEQQNALKLDHHYATANATSTGLFGLVSGLNGLYYMDAKKQGLQMPALKILEQAGYQFNLYASRDVHYADVYEFMFSYLDHQLVTEYEKKVALADAELVKHFKNSLRENSNTSAAPRFDFMILYSTHYDYFYPDKHRLFTPDKKRGLANTEVPNIFAGKEGWYVLFNRYQNAAHYVDSLMAEILQAIEQHSNPEDWIIVFTGDHGEELGEYGQIGHSFGFRKEQIQVPALIVFPSAAPIMRYSTTGHEDLMPSLFAYMGLNKNMQGVMTGKNLFEYDANRDFATSIANMMSFDTRYTQVIIDKELKLRINDREYPQVQKVLTLDDNAAEINEEKAGGLIQRYFNMTLQLPGEC